MTSAGRRIMLSATAILGLAGPAAAQDAPRSIPGLGNFQLEPSRPAPVPTPTPSATPSAIPIPDAPRIVLPTPTATPTPNPTATSPMVTPTPRAPQPIPTPTPSARNTPAPAASSVPAPTATPSDQPTTAPTPAGSPTPALAPVSAPAPEMPTDSQPFWPWLAGVAVIASLAFVLLRRRQRPVQPVETLSEPVADAAPPPASPPTPVIAPVPETAPSADPRARVTLSLTPLRAGLNLLSATVDCEITITNTGSVAAEDIRLDVRLLAAGPGQDGELAAIYAQPPVRPSVPVFVLAPGESRQVKAFATLARGAITPMAAGGRPMFVPIVAISARYRANPTTPGQTSQAFAVGIERVDSAKLAPLWLDQPARMHAGVAARPHAAVLES